MVLMIGQIVAGLFLLFLGGEALVRGSVALARVLGLSTLVIGLTVVAYGTSMPELVVSVQSAIKEYPGITLGNIIGSNISNILLVLGAAAVIAPITTRHRLARREGVFAAVITLLLLGLCATGTLSLLHGLLFLAILTGFTWYLFYDAKKMGALPEHMAEEVEEQIQAQMGTKGALLFIMGGLALLVGGSEVLITGAVELARTLGISEAVIGLTIIAVGSSAPELVTAVVAACRKHADIALGNIIGSNIFNIIGVLGITAVIYPIPVDPRFLTFDLWVMLGVTIALVPVMLTGKTISRVEGAVFLSAYVAYVAWQYLNV